MAYKWTKARLAVWRRTLKLYGITPEQLSELRTRLIVAQGFRCAICNANLSGRTCFLDHDHHSGAIRGILCYRCNRFWVAKNSQESSIQIVRYLNSPPAQSYLTKWGIEAHNDTPPSNRGYI
jgi:Recombination endonuclease VII